MAGLDEVKWDEDDVEKDLDNTEKNVWQAFLSQANTTSIRRDASLLVLGDINSGKSSLISKFMDVTDADDLKKHVMDMSYMDVRAPEDDSDIVAQVAICQVSNPEYDAIVNSMVDSIEKLCIMIVLDLA
jgi:hypothetical protein